MVGLLFGYWGLRAVELLVTELRLRCLRPPQAYCFISTVPGER